MTAPTMSAERPEVGTTGALERAYLAGIEEGAQAAIELVCDENRRDMSPRLHKRLWHSRHAIASAMRIATETPATAARVPAREGEDGFNLIAHLHRQREFSRRTFGPGERSAGVLDHIRKELREIEADPRDLPEWIDVVLLAFDGAWRHGHAPEAIVAALAAKQARNEARDWPDWRTADPNKAIEHTKPAARLRGEEGGA